MADQEVRVINADGQPVPSSPQKTADGVSNRIIQADGPPVRVGGKASDANATPQSGGRAINLAQGNQNI